MYRPEFCTDRKRMPILKKEQIGNIAQNFVQDFCPAALERPQALDVEEFVEFYLHLDLDYRFFVGENAVLGMTVFCDYEDIRGGTIVINKELANDGRQRHRYRFTVAHECGHWVFHRRYYDYNPDQVELFATECDGPCYTECRSVNQREDSFNMPKWSDERWREWHADKFASAFLMPKRAVDIMKKGFGRDLSSGKDVFDFVNMMVEVFDVSAQAAFYRLVDLKYAGFNSFNEGQTCLIRDD